MVDEVDSVLIDDARTPLIISGPVAKGDDQSFHIHKPRVLQLVQEQERIVRNCLNEAKKRFAKAMMIQKVVVYIYSVLTVVYQNMGR
jgi:preprotein translocase subunit SecA